LERVPRLYELMGYGYFLVTNKTYVAKTAERIDLWCDILTRLPQYTPPSRFSGGILKLKDATYLIFKSGKVIINGLRPRRKEFSLLTQMTLRRPKLSHCSGKMRFDKAINLEKLCKQLNGAKYDPGLRPGLSYKMKNISLIIHSTGKCIFRGCKTIIEAGKLVKKVQKVINTTDCWM